MHTQTRKQTQPCFLFTRLSLDASRRSTSYLIEILIYNVNTIARDCRPLLDIHCGQHCRSLDCDRLHVQIQSRLLAADRRPCTADLQLLPNHRGV
jgi:hypothetical protein